MQDRPSQVAASCDAAPDWKLPGAMRCQLAWPAADAYWSRHWGSRHVLAQRALQPHPEAVRSLGVTEALAAASPGLIQDAAVDDDHLLLVSVAAVAMVAAAADAKTGWWMTEAAAEGNPEYLQGLVGRWKAALLGLQAGGRY